MRQIDQDTYLKALGLFVLANDLYTQMRRVELTLEKLLDVEEGGHVADALYRDNATRADFDEALFREKIAFPNGELK